METLSKRYDASQGPDPRREALRAALESRTFRRSDQLRRFLVYIVDLEIAGNRDAITEYLIARNALGRDAQFSAETDSSVRTRAHSLRQKLEEFYAHEADPTTWRIVLPRGSYVPEFRPPAAPEAVPTPPARAPDTPRTRLTVILLSVVCGLALLAGAFAIGARWASPGRGVAPPLRSLWAPMVQPANPAAIVVGEPAQVWIRNYPGLPVPTIDPPFEDPPPSSPRFLRWYDTQTRGSARAGRLVLHPSGHSTLWGDSLGAALAASFITRMGGGSDILPERALGNEYALRRRPLILLGRPEFSPLIENHLRKARFTVGYRPDLRSHALFDQKNPSHYYQNQTDLRDDHYGLATVITDNDRRVMVFSGIFADGTQGAVEYLLDANRLAELRRKMGLNPGAGWPPRFQVVVRTRSADAYALKFDYVEHHVP
jgi:hypothetical protein